MKHPGLSITLKRSHIDSRPDVIRQAERSVSICQMHLISVNWHFQISLSMLSIAGEQSHSTLPREGASFDWTHATPGNLHIYTFLKFDIQWKLSWETTDMKDHCLEGPHFPARRSYMQCNWTSHQRPPVLRDPIFMANEAVFQDRFYCI